ncbi:S-formylglutathione hydrolase [Psychrobacter sp. FDAARGOS_221]|uniref:S-formylglutathione hydrolase n=1 Tax=Psychrobacter sp. FDAARGOS_221 TaxID=1975705 RepID=UPI000BB59736|nr:S-formylglutathione hydrolase [Psychrobacter sp. FDAARGOS_221]PNK60176.1 S-formylglutathione hydrolase [Psychrobacter sp. FDAARGOS_221]
MSKLTLTSKNRCFNGEQHYYTHQSSTTNSEMSFSIYLPDEALAGNSCPAVMYLSGLTCSPDNVTHKAHAQQKCSELGVIFIAPDTSPKGDNVPNDDRYFVGQAASYYVDATQAPWSENFNMHSYIIDELYELVREQFAISSIGITGHSMGGHGALMFGFKYPSKFVSVSAIAPVCVASESEWGQAAFTEYFGADSNQGDSAWSQYDAVTAVTKAGKLYPSILVDQGGADDFYLQGYLCPEALQKACQQVEQPLTLRYHAGFDHSYYYIQTVIEDHIEHHYNAALSLS